MRTFCYIVIIIVFQYDPHMYLVSTKVKTFSEQDNKDKNERYVIYIYLLSIFYLFVSVL